MTSPISDSNPSNVTDNGRYETDTAQTALLPCPQALAEFNSLIGGELSRDEISQEAIDTIRCALQPTTPPELRAALEEMPEVSWNGLEAGEWLETHCKAIRAALTAESEAAEVCAEAYQLVGAIVADYPDLIPNAEKWLDNLSDNRMTHRDLLPVALQQPAPPDAQVSAGREFMAENKEAFAGLADAEVKAALEDLDQIENAIVWLKNLCEPTTEHIRRWAEEGRPFFQSLRKHIKSRASLQTPTELAAFFHETYERLAPDFGYKTRSESSVPWDSVPENNKNLMVATCAEVLSRLHSQAAKPLTVGVGKPVYTVYVSGDESYHIFSTATLAESFADQCDSPCVLSTYLIDNPSRYYERHQ